MEDHMIKAFMAIGIILFLFIFKEYINNSKRPNYNGKENSPYKPAPTNTTINHQPPQPLEPVIESKNSELFMKWKNEQMSIILQRKSVYQLVQENNIRDIKYVDLLNTYEWSRKRIEILIRDNFKCQECNIYHERLEVHHNYYITDKLPWDIRNEALVTLCREHHQNRHNNKSIPVYKLMHNVLVSTTVRNYFCYRCFGMGYIPQYKHVQNGICFSCWGECFDQTIFSKALRDIKYTNYDLDTIFNTITQHYFDEFIFPNLQIYSSNVDEPPF